MPNWKNASKGDQKRLTAIETILKIRPALVEQLFHPFEPCLRTSPENVLRGLPSGERSLVALAIDVWRNSDESRTQHLLSLDARCFANVMEALAFLRAS